MLYYCDVWVWIVSFWQEWTWSQTESKVIITIMKINYNFNHWFVTCASIQIQIRFRFILYCPQKDWKLVSTDCTRAEVHNTRIRYTHISPKYKYTESAKTENCVIYSPSCFSKIVGLYVFYFFCGTQKKMFWLKKSVFRPYALKIKLQRRFWNWCYRRAIINLSVNSSSKNHFF